MQGISPVIADIVCAKDPTMYFVALFLLIFAGILRVIHSLTGFAKISNPKVADAEERSPTSKAQKGDTSPQSIREPKRDEKGSLYRKTPIPTVITENINALRMVE